MKGGGRMDGMLNTMPPRFYLKKAGDKIEISLDMLVTYWPRREKTCTFFFLTKQVSNQSPQLHRLARTLKFFL